MACLKNRYQEDLGEIKSESAKTIVKKEKSKHITSAGYFYQYERSIFSVFSTYHVLVGAHGVGMIAIVEYVARLRAWSPQGNFFESFGL